MTAVSATIEMESYLQPKPSRIAQVEPEKGTEPVIAAIQHQQTALLSTPDKVMEQLDKLEMKTPKEPPKRPSVGPGGGSGQRPVVCRVTGKGIMLRVVHHYNYLHRQEPTNVTQNLCPYSQLLIPIVWLGP